LLLSAVTAALGAGRRLLDQSWPARYGAALIFTAGAVGFKLLFLDRISLESPFLILPVAVVLAAWAGGLGPSLLATAVCAVAADWFWLEPRFALLTGSPDEAVRLVLFGVEGVLIGLIATRPDGPRAGGEGRPPGPGAGQPWLAASERRHRRLLDGVRDFAVFLLDADGRVATWNAGAERVLGYPEAEALGRPYAAFAPAAGAGGGRPEDELRAAAERGRSEHTGWRERRDGSRFWAEAIVTAWRDDAGRVGYSVVLRDVTARREAEGILREREQALRHAQRMEAVGRLAGGVAHDFNNLLTVILGNLDLVLEGQVPADATRGLLEDVRRAGQRAANLTRQLLSFSRRQPIAPRRLDLNAVVADLESILRRVIGEHIVLVIDPRPGLGPVFADPGQVEQVLMNLCVNARDAMPKGGTLTVSTAEEEVGPSRVPADAEGVPGRYIVLTVADTGCGMDAETRARLFEPFFTTKEVGKGTGLGLATVYGIVRLAGGWVTVDSRPEEGATFRVYLPRAEGPAEVPRDQSPAARPRGAETLLLVEDEPALRDLAKRVLEGRGYTVLAAPDGEAGLRAARIFSGPIDLLVTDLVMPRMNGRQLAKELKVERPGIRVLFMSGYTDSVLGGLGSFDPGDELLDKPFLPDQLASTVREVLDRGRPESP
jgi:PAS domain S-box-containing protein